MPDGYQLAADAEIHFESHPGHRPRMLTAASTAYAGFLTAATCDGASAARACVARSDLDGIWIVRFTPLDPELAGPSYIAIDRRGAPPDETCRLIERPEGGACVEGSEGGTGSVEILFAGPHEGASVVGPFRLPRDGYALLSVSGPSSCAEGPETRLQAPGRGPDHKQEPHFLQLLPVMVIADAIYVHVH